MNKYTALNTKHPVAKSYDDNTNIRKLLNLKQICY